MKLLASRKPRERAWRSAKELLHVEGEGVLPPCPGLLGHLTSPGRHRLSHGSYLCDYLPSPCSLCVTCFLHVLCDKGH